jgi:S-DNA-T family DNA segregation ATPase FtsK/SpoIIIE
MTLDTVQGVAVRATKAAPRVGWALVRDAARQARKHPRWAIVWATVVALAVYYQHNLLALEVFAGVAVPALLVAVVSRCWPNLWRRRVAAPRERNVWVRWARSNWPRLSEECGLTGTRPVMQKTQNAKGKWVMRSVQAITRPELVDVSFKGSTLTMVIRIRFGQTVDDLSAAGEAICAAMGGVSYRVTRGQPGVLTLHVLTVDHLAAPRLATMPSGAVPKVPGAVTIGRNEDNTPCVLQISGRHSLVVGCSGAGKGSVFWGVMGGLAPSIRAGLVEAQALDMKLGVEVTMGRELFTAIASERDEALVLLTRLRDRMNVRGRAMAGVSRAHTPTKSEPLVCLLIDELADLLAYSDPATKKTATGLLSEILTKGRALGFSVVACMQDPRKEVIPSRGLFTQILALRLRSPEEVTMTLGAGMAAKAPAHHISPATPGVGYVVADDGQAMRIRPDYWTDDMVRAVAARYATPLPSDMVRVPAAGRRRRGTAEVNAENEAQAAADRAALADIEAQIRDDGYGDLTG